MRPRPLLCALLLSLLSAGMAAALVKAQDEIHSPGQATATPGPAATPTVDRLAAPPTAENPDQTDDGAQLFWLHCQPCHGDRGQGLTDEWRAQYPLEDQNCWESGCHGNQPYENGFILPERVPAVIGGDSLRKFAHLGQVYEYVRAAMPFQDPGALSEDEYLAIVAFLARAHDAWPGAPLTAENVYDVRFAWAPPIPATMPTPATGRDISTSERTGPSVGWLAAAGGMAVLLVGGLALWRQRDP